MPIGKKYSKNARKWVPIETERRIDYGDQDLFDEDAWALLVSYWRAYPDKMLDVLESDTPMYALELSQRVDIRAMCLYQHTFITGSRGKTKSFEALTSEMILGVLYPGIIKRYYGPTQEQMAEIVSEKYEAICKQYPGLASHWDVISNSQERFEIKTKTGSVLSITVVRGNDCNGITAEEVAQQEKGKAFDFQTFSQAILPTARLQRMVNRDPDPFFPNYQKKYVTSAGTQQCDAYQYRMDTYREMVEGKSAFCVDYPWTVPVLEGVRNKDYYDDLRKKQTPEAQLREIESIWTGTSENPVIRDSTLTESKTLAVMENRHCQDPDAIYVIGYDVSYAEGANNAKCATAVLKCERQTAAGHQDRYRKSLVYIVDNPPPKEQILQARQLKDRWYRFCYEGGKGTYIAIDAWQYGKGVVEALHSDLGDGLPPLCCVNHEFPELERDGAIPVIYAIKATGGFGGSHDSDSGMLRYAELEFEHRNVQLLIPNIYDGVQAYKRMHRIKDDALDATISIPYIKTREMCGQIANLVKKPSGSGVSENRISNSIQRDMWSAAKYALRYAEILEHQELVAGIQRTTAWSRFFKEAGETNSYDTDGELSYKIAPRVIAWKGGNNIQ